MWRVFTIGCVSQSQHSRGCMACKGVAGKELEQKRFLIPKGHFPCSDRGEEGSLMLQKHDVKYLLLPMCCLHVGIVVFLLLYKGLSDIQSCPFYRLYPATFLLIFIYPVLLLLLLFFFLCVFSISLLCL